MKDKDRNWLGLAFFVILKSIYLSIYYLIGVSRDTCLRSPYVDVFKECLFLHV